MSQTIRLKFDSGSDLIRLLMYFKKNDNWETINPQDVAMQSDSFLIKSKREDSTFRTSLLELSLTLIDRMTDRVIASIAPPGVDEFAVLTIKNEGNFTGNRFTSVKLATQQETEIKEGESKEVIKWIERLIELDNQKSINPL